MKTPQPPTVGTSGPRRPFPTRPHPPESYRAVGKLPDLLLACKGIAEAATAEIVDFRRTAKRAWGAWADTFSHGVLRLPSGELSWFCTTFSGQGHLILETPAGRHFTTGEVAAMARAVQEGHRRILGSTSAARRK